MMQVSSYIQYKNNFDRLKDRQFDNRKNTVGFKNFK